MIIKKVKLRNIRSYLEEEINFPEGSLLLSGDVGSGKSSVLLAIDFALFGLTRGVLSGGALLRNGVSNGEVELHLDINNKDIVIKRNLKRNEKSVVQDSGYILIDGNKIEGTAIELKAKVLELLNYPKDLLTKSKSLVYRFTVYTPQEEMKRILTEDSEDRLEILRRVFDIDKYKRIQENCNTVIRKLKEQIREGEVLISGLEEKRIEKSKLENEVKDYKKERDRVVNEINLFEIKLKKVKKSLERYERKIKRFNVIKNKLILVNNNIEHKTNEKNKIEEELKNLNEEILNDESLLKDFKDGFEGETLDEIEELEIEINRKEEKLNKIRDKLSEFNYSLRNSEDMISKIKNLDKCPTCFQLVTDEHKSNITKVENEKLDVSKKNIEIFKENENNLSKEIKDFKEKLTMLQKEVNDCRILKVRVEGLESKKNLRERCERELSLVFDFLGEMNERKKELEFRFAGNENLEEKHSVNKEKSEKLNEKIKRLEIDKGSLEERIRSVEGNIERVEGEILEKTNVKTRVESLSSVLKWLSEQFLEMMEKMERSVMFRLHKDFNMLFNNWFNILIDNENLNVRLDNEFSPVIIQDGYEIEYEFLSGGEKTAAALAYRLSLNQVINNLMSLIETKDVIILDEPTDGFSSEQLNRVRIVLDELDIKQVIIVSHEDKIESFVDNVLRFEKKGHVSRILR